MSGTAREHALALFRLRMEDAAAADLAARLGAEIRAEVEAELRDEWELDLKRIREEMFDLGVRTAVRIATEQRSISPTAAAQLAPKLAAHQSRVRLVGRIRDRATEADPPAATLDEFVAALERELP
jgi:hypothetical protein